MNNIGEKPDIRERVLEYGIEKAEDEDLIMLLLGSGYQGMPVGKLAEKVLNQIKLHKPEELLNSLIRINGMGIGKSSLVCAALELGRRFSYNKGIVIRCPEDIIPLVQHYTLELQEHFICISLNGAHEVLKIRVVSIGTLNGTLIHPREIFAEPLKERAAAVVLCHNHPSGSLLPSDVDLETTCRLKDASQLLGIRLLDHIILSQKGHFSFVENGIDFFKNDRCIGDTQYT